MKTPARPRGRPPKMTPAEPRIPIGLRVSPEVKEVLDQQARAHGHTQSQEAVRLIQLGLVMGAASPAVSDALQAMVKAAADVGAAVGDPAASMAARDELRRRWRDIAANVLPHVTEPAAISAAKAAISATRFAALDAYTAASGVNAPSPALQKAKDHMAAMNGASGRPSDPLFPGRPDWPQARSELKAAADEYGGTVGGAISALLDIADAAERALAHAEGKVQ